MKFNEFNNEIVNMYTIINENITADIIKSLSKTGKLNSFSQSQLETLIQTNGKQVFAKALNEINNLSNEQKQGILNVFNTMVDNDLSNYKELFEYNDIPFKLSEEQIMFLKTSVNNVNGDLNNLTNTIALASKETYTQALSTAYLSVKSGGITFSDAMKKVTNQLAVNGILISDTSGRKMSPEVVARQNLKYASMTTMRALNDQLDKELGCDGVQVNISVNCRPDHQVINGQTFSNEEWLKYKDLLNDYGCQHYTDGIIMEISKNRYSEDEIKETNERTVNFMGKDIPYYEATQMQRALERQVRYAKRELYTLQKANQDTSNAKTKLSKTQSAVRSFIKETGLDRNYDREYVAK